MSGASPSRPLVLLTPGEYVMMPYGASSAGVGQIVDFNSAAAAASAAAGIGSVASGLTAVTGTIGAVGVVPAQFSAYGMVPSGGGARLPVPGTVPYPVAIANYGASGLSVFPPTVSGQIDAAGSGVAFLQATGTVQTYYFAGGNQYYA